MADDKAWDDEDFDTDKQIKNGRAPVNATDRWSGEDEDDDIKETWEDTDEEDKEAKKEAIPAPQPKKKSLSERIAEKEEKKRKEREEKRKREEEEKKLMTPEEQLAEKLRQQKIQEDSDLELAKEAFGVSMLPPANTIDSMSPTSKEEFDDFSKSLVTKITQFEKSTFYVQFLENVFRDCSLSLEAEDIKKISGTLNALANEKNKSQKGSKSKKNKKKATIMTGKANDYGDYMPDAMDEFDDFM